MGAVVFEGLVKVDSGPAAGSEAHGAAEHLVGGGRVDPVGGGGEGTFVGMDEVDVEVAVGGVGAVAVVKGDAADGTGLADFAGAIKLFGEGIAAIIV